MSILQKIIVFLNATPYFGFIAFYALVWRVYQWIGHLPYSNTPDPLHTPFQTHTQAVYLCFPLAAVALILALLGSIYLLLKRYSQSKTWFAATLLNFLLYILLFKYSPFLANWFID